MIRRILAAILLGLGAISISQLIQDRIAPSSANAAAYIIQLSFWIWIVCSAVIKVGTLFDREFQRIASASGRLWAINFLAMLGVFITTLDTRSRNPHGAATHPLLVVIFFLGWPLFDQLAVTKKFSIIRLGPSKVESS
jgi:hypothetical protein